jgi:quinol monooxygenase YgiN
MAEVRVIARSVARKEKGAQLGDLLQGMLAPTCAESGCRLYELYE